MAFKKKAEGKGLDFKVFSSADGTQYMVFRGLDGSFHTFVEVEAKEAARECGATKEGNTRHMWESLWEGTQ